MINRILMQIRFYRWWWCLREIKLRQVPPADNSCCWRVQNEIYVLKKLAELALQNKERHASH